MSGREAWRLITTWNAEPGFNMALDEALLRSREARPTLRFYSWKPGAVSLGYFQRFAELSLLPTGNSPPPALVRRMTGGGAIHHSRELTFSISAPGSHALFRGPVARSYARVHGALAEALATLGIEASLRGDQGLASDLPGSPMCFHHSTPVDLVWGGRKGVGSAQRRTGGRVLHHGSIKIGTTDLEGEIATVASRAAGIGPEDLAEAVLEAFRSRLPASFERSSPTRREREQALARAGHFVSRGFVERR